jgi:hypothetical protein
VSGRQSVIRLAFTLFRPQFIDCHRTVAGRNVRRYASILIQGQIGGANMIDKAQEDAPKTLADDIQVNSTASQERRAVLKKLGRFAAVTVPTVTLLLAASTKPAKAPCTSCVSSRQFKTVGEDIDATAVLDGLAGLAVERWRYKSETGLEQGEHIGAYVEDFQAAFGVGDGVTISNIDAIGVCLAAIKALSAKVESLEAELRTRDRRKAA